MSGRRKSVPGSSSITASSSKPNQESSSSLFNLDPKYGPLLVVAALSLICVDGVFFLKLFEVYFNILTFLLQFIAFATRLFSVLRFESVIHEFDPYDLSFCYILQVRN